MYTVARFAVGSADRLLVVLFSIVRDSTLPSVANQEMFSLAPIMMLTLEERKVSARSYYDAHKEGRQASFKDLL